MCRKNLFLIVSIVCFNASLHAQQWITDKPSANSFAISTAAIYTDTADYILVQRAAGFLQQDMEMITGGKPALVTAFADLKGYD